MLQETATSEELDWSSLGSPTRSQDLASSSAVKWILETSTDMDIITTGVNMILEIEWPTNSDVTDVLVQLNTSVRALVLLGRLYPHGRLDVQKAIYHLSVERNLGNPFNSGLWCQMFRAAESWSTLLTLDYVLRKIFVASKTHVMAVGRVARRTCNRPDILHCGRS